MLDISPGIWQVVPDVVPIGRRIQRQEEQRNKKHYQKENGRESHEAANRIGKLETALEACEPSPGRKERNDKYREREEENGKHTRPRQCRADPSGNSGFQHKSLGSSSPQTTASGNVENDQGDQNADNYDWQVKNLQQAKKQNNVCQAPESKAKRKRESFEGGIKGQALGKTTAHQPGNESNNPDDEVMLECEDQ